MDLAAIFAHIYQEAPKLSAGRLLIKLENILLLQQSKRLTFDTNRYMVNHTHSI